MSYYRLHQVFETAKAIQFEASVKGHPGRFIKKWVPKSLCSKVETYANVEMYEIVDWFSKREMAIFVEVDKYNQAI